MSRFQIKGTRTAEDSPTHRQELIGWWQQERLNNARILIIGAGAIGNETIKNLALLGIGEILIADFDTISTSNLSRTVLFRSEDVGKQKAHVAAQRARELAVNPNFRVSYFHGDVVWELGTGVYQSVDLVLACLDNIECRCAVNRHCWRSGTPWIDAGIFELGCRVNVYIPRSTPCYECMLSPDQLASAAKRYSCDNFKKRMVAEGKVPTVQVASALVSALQVQEAIKLLHGDHSAAGKKLYFQGKNNAFDINTLNSRDDCYGHAVSYPELINSPLNRDVSTRVFLESLNDADAEIDISADFSFIESLTCAGCASSISLRRPSFRVHEDERYCSVCRDAAASEKVYAQPTDKETVSRISLSESPSDLLDLSLHEIGFPAGGIVTINSNRVTRYVCLSHHDLFSE